MLSIPVKIESIERRRRSISLLHVVAGFYLIGISTTYFGKLGYTNLIKVAPFFIVAIVSIAYGFFFKKKDKKGRYNHIIRSMQFGFFFGLGMQFYSFNASWTSFSLFIWAVVSFLLMISEKGLFNHPTIHLEDEGIKVPGLLNDNIIEWQLIETVVARPDYFTISRHDKKFIQLEMSADISISQLEEINSFSKQQIAAAKVEETA